MLLLLHLGRGSGAGGLRAGAFADTGLAFHRTSPDRLTGFTSHGAAADAGPFTGALRSGLNLSRLYLPGLHQFGTGAGLDTGSSRGDARGGRLPGLDAGQGLHAGQGFGLMDPLGHLRGDLLGGLVG